MILHECQKFANVCTRLKCDWCLCRGKFWASPSLYILSLQKKFGRNPTCAFWRSCVWRSCVLYMIAVTFWICIHKLPWPDKGVCAHAHIRSLQKKFDINHISNVCNRWQIFAYINSRGQTEVRVCMHTYDFSFWKVRVVRGFGSLLGVQCAIVILHMFR